MTHCPHCGNELPDGAVFCNQCWRELASTTAAAAPTAEVPTQVVGAAPVPESAPPPDMPAFEPLPGPPGGSPPPSSTSQFPQAPPVVPPSPWAAAAPAPPQPTYGAPPAYGPPGAAAPGAGGYGPPPGGYGGAPAPGYGTPAYGYPPPPGYGYQWGPPSAGTNGMAIAALVCALSGLISCGLTSVLGVVFGHIALHQLKTDGKEGRSLAMAGLIIGYVFTALFVGFVLLTILGSNTTYD